MTKFQTKLTTAFATGAVLLNALAPLASADTTLTITGNGSDSTSNASVAQANNTTVTQTNATNISNNVSSNANTGGNQANDNTGGNVAVHTGDATTDTQIKNTAGSNAANISNCNCNTDAAVEISGNGHASDNTASLTNTNTTALFQTNATSISNDVDAKAKTGDNKANDNTGGNVDVHTGDATTLVRLNNTANANTAVLGGGLGAHNGTLSAIIKGNGSDSSNTLDLASSNDVLLSQTNVADISNVVDAKSETGDNRANDNTGGNVNLHTGDAWTGVAVDNMAGFNSANIEDCSCLTDLTAKIAGNGADSDNTIDWAGSNELAAFQTNATSLDNDLSHLKSDSGDNKANDNTGSVSANDPSVTTGDADSVTSVKNQGGSNVLGQGLGVMNNVDFNVDFSSLWALFMSHVSM